MLALYEKDSPVDISIFDCSDQISDDWKKDAEYMFQAKVADFTHWLLALRFLFPAL